MGTVGGIVRGTANNPGDAINAISLTSGDVGVARDGVAAEGMTRAKAAAIREAETTAAAHAIGVKEITFFREPDGMVVNDIALRRRMVREIRLFQPEVVVTADPSLLYTPHGGINHPDHRAVGGAALDAVFPASGQPNLFEELAGEGVELPEFLRGAIWACRRVGEEIKKPGG